MSQTGQNHSLMLQAWFSPGYPVGAYAYSHALEYEIEIGKVHNGETLEVWLEDMLRWGAGWTDAVLIGEVYRTMDRQSTQPDVLVQLSETVTAMMTSAEFRQESLQQGSAFLEITRSAWPHVNLDLFAQGCQGIQPYIICVALAGASHEVEQDALVQAYLLAMGSNWVSAAIRLNAIGQSEGQRRVAKLLPLINAISQGAKAETLDTLGSCTFINDIASFRHETLASRLFRS